MNKSIFNWHSLGYAVIVLIVLWAFISLVIKPSKRSDTKCDAPDSYDTRLPNDYRLAECPAPKQKLTITREGNLIGSYEYRCHCE